MSAADRNGQGLPAGFVVSLADSLKFIIKGVGTVTPRGEQPPEADTTAPPTTRPTPEPPPDHHRV